MTNLFQITCQVLRNRLQSAVSSQLDNVVITKLTFLTQHRAAGRASQRKRVVPSGSIFNQRLLFPCSSAFMTGAPSNRYCRWFEYEKTPHRKMPTLFSTLPTEQRVSSSLRIANLFAHLMAARRLYFSRFDVLSECLSDLFPQRVPRKSLNSPAAEMQTSRSAYLERPDETELALVFEDSSLEGPPFRNCVEDILTTALWSLLVRRQRVALVKDLGGNLKDGKVAIITSRSEGRREIPSQEESKL